MSALAGFAFLGTEQAALARSWDFPLSLCHKCRKKRSWCCFPSFMGTCEQSEALSQSQGDIWLVERVCPHVSIGPPGQNSGISNSQWVPPPKCGVRLCVPTGWVAVSGVSRASGTIPRWPRHRTSLPRNRGAPRWCFRYTRAGSRRGGGGVRPVRTTVHPDVWRRMEEVNHGPDGSVLHLQITTWLPLLETFSELMVTDFMVTNGASHVLLFARFWPMPSATQATAGLYTSTITFLIFV